MRDGDADEDDQGDPESPTKHFHRQLHRIRRGEPIDQLTVLTSQRYGHKQSVDALPRMAQGAFLPFHLH